MSAVFGNIIGDGWGEGIETLASINSADARDMMGHYARANAADPNAAGGGGLGRPPRLDPRLSRPETCS